MQDVLAHPKFGAIAGCMVTEGLVKRNNPIRVLRDNILILKENLNLSVVLKMMSVKYVVVWNVALA